MRFIPRFSVLAPVFATALCAFSVSAQAQSAPQNAQARYLQDIEKCRTHNTQDSLATCLREAGAARDASSKGQLTGPGAEATTNATQRCEAFQTAAEQADCVRRVQSTPASGSVESGGVLRESVTTTITPR